MKRWYILFLAVLMSSPPTYTADSLRVRQIILVGNDKTKDQIILREMKTKEGDLFNDARVEVDRMRIQNLRLFTKVEMHPIPAEGAVDLLIVVSERWYVFPYLIFNVNDRSWDKLSYGAGLAHQNIGGRNIYANGSFWLGYNPGMSVQYVNPWIKGTRNLFFKGSLYSKKITNKNSGLPDFQERHQGGAISLGKRWGLHTYLAVEAGYRRVTLPKELKASLSANGVDQVPQAGIQFTYDRRDLHEYPRNGWFLSLHAVEFYNPDQIHFQKYSMDIRRYQPLYKQISLAGRMAANFSKGVLPLYERYFLGFQERIRGYFAQQSEGDQQLVTSFELRFPLLPVRYFNLGDPDSPLGSYMNNLPFGISGGIFWDSGAVWDHLTRMDGKKFKQGFGLGLHIHLPYVDVLRIEYAFNKQGHPEFITDLYVWF